MNSNNEIKKMNKEIKKSIWHILSWKFDPEKSYAFEVVRLKGDKLKIKFYAERADNTGNPVKVIAGLDQARELKQKLQKALGRG